MTKRADWRFEACHDDRDAAGTSRPLEPRKAEVSNAIRRLDGMRYTSVAVTAESGDDRRWLSVFGGAGGMVGCSVSTPMGDAVEWWLLDPAASADESHTFLSLEGVRTRVPRRRCVPLELAIRAATAFLDNAGTSEDLQWEPVR